MKQLIEAEFIREYGRWDKFTNSYQDRQEKKYAHLIEMEIVEHDDRTLLRFIGGPTGHEVYNVMDILNNPPQGEHICICAGTFNEHYSCSVPSEEVMDFLAEYVTNKQNKEK